MSTAADEAVLELAPAAHAPAAPKIANVPGRLGSLAANLVAARVGLPWKRRLAKASLVIPSIRVYEARYLTLNDEDLRKEAMRLRGLARGGSSLDKLIPQAFGLTSVAIRRIHGFQPFDVQLAAGVIMHFGGLVELATGEGKTLSACPGVPERPARQGRPRHHRERLPCQARRRRDGAGVPAAGHDRRVPVQQKMQDGPTRVTAYKLRRHLRHRQRVRVRLPARPPEGARRAGGHGTRVGAVVRRRRAGPTRGSSAS